MTLVEYGNFAAGDLSDFGDSSANGSASPDYGVTISDSDWVYGKYKATFKANAATTPVYYGDSSNVRIHLLASPGNVIEDTFLQQGNTFYRALSIKWVTGGVTDNQVLDEIHSSGAGALANGPVPLNVTTRGSQWSWVIRGADDPNDSAFIQWFFGQSPMGQEDGSSRFSQSWAAISNAITTGEWIHTLGIWNFHPTNGSFTLWACAHGDVMSNVVPTKTGIGTCFPSPITHYPMMSLYYDRSITGDRAVSYAAGAYGDTLSEIQSWQATQVGYDLWNVGTPDPPPAEYDSVPSGYMGGSYIASTSTPQGSQADKQRCYKVTVETTGTITHLGHYRDPTDVAGTETIKLAIWPDNGSGTDPGSGSPLAQTAEVSFTSASALGRYSTALTTPLDVTAGDILWVGELNGGTANIAYTGSHTVSNAFRLMSRTYASGVTNWDTAADTAYDIDLLIWLEGTATNHRDVGSRSATARDSNPGGRIPGLGGGGV